MNDCRYVKWQSNWGLAYARIPSDYNQPHVNGATLTGIVSVAVDDEGLVDVGKSEYDLHMDQWWSDMDARLALIDESEYWRAIQNYL